MISVASRTAAAELASFCGSLHWSELSADVRDRVRELVLDLIGVAIAGSRAPSSPPAMDVASRVGGKGRSTLIGTDRRTSAVWAAMANGTAAHAIEMDDVTTESSLHPGVAVIPAALALAEELQASPSAFLEAVIAGYEVTMRVGNALNPASAYSRGFHPTGVAGTFGAAIAACRLLELDVERTVHALGIAGTMTSGSLEYLSDGAWTKRLNAGWAGHSGITAALLAQAGFTGPSSVFEGRLGVLHAFSDDADPTRLLADLGDPLQVMRVSIKPYACCRYNHGLIDCVLDLAREHSVKPDDVDQIRLGVLSGGALLVAEPIERKRAPDNVVDAQFSAPYAAAAALVFGSGGLDAYTPERVHNTIVRRLMDRTERHRSAELDAVYPRQWPAEVELHLRDGQTLKRRIEHATGEPENPVPRAALLRKFIDLTCGREELADLILSIDAEPDLSRLGVALRNSN